MAGRRPASWTWPTAKQLRVENARKMLTGPEPPPKTDEECWWDSMLRDPRAETNRPSPARTLGAIRSSDLRVECLRCFRTVEISRADAVKLYGAEARWSDVGSKLLADGFRHRTGSHEEDGCWPDFRS